jgi:hypothetical protein
MSNRPIKVSTPETPPKKEEQKPLGTKLRKILGVAISGLVTLVGLVVALLTLLPRPAVTPSDPVDPDNPLSASFTIANNNFIPLRRVSASLGIGEIQPVGKPLDPVVEYAEQGTLTPDAWIDHTLEMDDHYTITPYDVIHATGDREAAIEIVVSYNPWIMPFRRKRIFRFATHRQTNGKLYWYSLPSN